MSSNNDGMFARACNRVDGGEFEEITVRYQHEPGTSPRILVEEVRGRNIHVSYCRYSEMNAAGWRRYGQSIKNSREK